MFQREDRTIFVCNLSFDLRDRDIENYFKQFGTILSTDVPRNEGQPINKGRAFIEFESAKSAQLALAANQQKLKGRPLQISLGLNNATTGLANSEQKFHFMKGSHQRQSKRKYSRSRSRSQDRY